MDRPSDTSLVAQNATIASKTHPPHTSTKLVDAQPNIIHQQKEEDTVPFDEKGHSKSHKSGTTTVKTTDDGFFQDPPSINWTPSNEEDMAEKLFPADNAVVPSVTTTTTTTKTMMMIPLLQLLLQKSC